MSLKYEKKKYMIFLKLLEFAQLFYRMIVNLRHARLDEKQLIIFALGIRLCDSLILN